jgi:hypothetical protein
MCRMPDEHCGRVVMRRQNVAQIVHRVRRCILVDENQVDRAATRLDHAVASRIFHVPRTDRIIAGLAERSPEQRAPPLIRHDEENSGSEGHGPMVYTGRNAGIAYRYLTQGLCSLPCSRNEWAHPLLGCNDIAA